MMHRIECARVPAQFLLFQLLWHAFHCVLIAETREENPREQQKNYPTKKNDCPFFVCVRCFLFWKKIIDA